MRSNHFKPNENHERIRNQIISFRVSPDERATIEAKAFVSGLPKAEFYLNCILGDEITVKPGRYESDRLAVELKRLRLELQNINSGEDEDLFRVILECRALLEELNLLQKKLE